MPNVVALHDEDRLVVDLHVALAQAQAANAKLRAIIRLLLALVAVLGGRLHDRRVPEAHHKRRLLAAVRHTSPALGRPAALRILGLTPERVRNWERRSLACTLDDAPSCPKHSPHQLTREERGTIRRYAKDLALRHLSTVSLALLAARHGHLFAAVSTWLREIHRLGIQRPGRRLHPRRSKVGVRASRPNELWHIDASRIRLLDGTVRWLHGIIDNHSRKILAWTVGTSCRAAATEALLRQAVAYLTPST
ncbi:MAG: DDE-type integrase/transposase/recombinase [Sandaracinaceae bacterium]|nr:DDE-type integrase/transposase/recombinase [Sandaracinaceae bacterium]